MSAELPPEFAEAFFTGQVPPGGWPPAFAIVTAHNPDGVLTSPEQNDAADAALSCELRGRHLAHFRVSGGSRDGRHREAGFGIVGISRNAAADLSRHWRQLAYFWIEKGQVLLIDSVTGKERPVGSWDERWLGPGD